MTETIGSTIRAKMARRIPAAAKTPKLGATIIAIACLSLAACGSQSGIGSTSASSASSPQSLSAASGSLRYPYIPRPFRPTRSTL